MHNSKESDQFSQFSRIRRLVQERLFASIDVNDQNCLNQLIQFAQTLQPSQSALKIVKNLIGGFGIAIMVYLKIFYDRMSAQFIDRYGQELKLIAAYAKQMCDKQEITELQFFFRYGILSKDISVTIRDLEKVFIDCAKSISKYYNQPVIESFGEIQFAIQMKKLLSKFQKHQLYARALLKFQQLSKKLHRKDQTTSQSISQVKQNSRSLFDFLGESDESSSDSSFFESAEKEKSKINSKHKQFNLSKNQGHSVSNNDNSNTIISDNSQTFISQKDTQVLGEVINNIKEIIPKQKLQEKIEINTPTKIGFEQKRTVKVKTNQNHLCCRKFFYEGQNIPYSDDTRISFNNPSYPFKGTEIFDIKNIMCSFLNTEGGILYIGVEKNSFGKRTIVGAEYSQSKKQAVLKTFRQTAQTIQPDIITHKMYNIYFVPVKLNYAPFSFIPGRFVIKCEVRYGIRDEVYSFHDGVSDRFVFRNQGEVFIKDGRMLLKTYKQRINNPLPIPEPTHQGSCEKPQIGQQIHVYEPQPAFYKNNNKAQNYHNPPKLRFTDRIPKSNEIKQSKEVQQFLPKQITSNSQQFSAKKKQILAKYFFVVGINEKQLVPILQKKRLNEFIKIESTKSKKIIVKVTDEAYNEKIHKILIKLSEKYPEISVYKMSLELRVASPREAFKVLEKKTDKFEIKDHILRYRYYKDSLEGFILLQDAKLAVQFVD